MEKNKKIPGILIGVIAIFVMTLPLFSFLNKNKTETGKSNNNLTEKNFEETASKETKDSVISEVGYVVKLNEKSIDFISLEKSHSDISVEEKEKSVKSFNINLNAPTTAVTKGVEGNNEGANLSDLRIGQEIIVEYDEKTRNVVTININQANIE